MHPNGLGMTSWRSPATKLINMLTVYIHYFTSLKTKQPPIGYDPLFWFRGSITLPVRSARFCPCGPAVFRFWPLAGGWLFCVGRVSVGPAVFQACAVGRASVGLAVFRFGLAVLGIGRGRASLGQNLPASAVKNHTFQLHSLNSRTTTKDSQAMN